MSESKKEVFKQITASQRWLSIQELIDALDGSDFWDEQFYEKSEREAKAHFIRKMMRSFKDETGFPQFASVEVALPDGQISRIYKQLDLFERDDFTQTRAYCKSKIRHFNYLYEGYTKRELQKFGTQTLLYPEITDQPTA
jgi:hypothetical protein